jgi:hypothetical protein
MANCPNCDNKISRYQVFRYLLPFPLICKRCKKTLSYNKIYFFISLLVALTMAQLATEIIFRLDMPSFKRPALTGLVIELVSGISEFLIIAILPIALFYIIKGLRSPKITVKDWRIDFSAKTIKKRILIFAVYVAYVYIAAISLPVIFNPNSLFIHISGAKWKQVIIQSDNFGQDKVFKSSDELATPDLAYGPYTIKIEYENGDILWSTFFHYDAGVRKTIDIFYSGNPESGSVKVQEITNKETNLFRGQVHTDKTSEKKPFRLDWI